MSNLNTLMPPLTCESQYKQRQLLALWTIPPPRLNLVSPYINTYDEFGNATLTYTRAQLDMRRKVEILKHADHDSHANGTTSKQKWSHLNQNFNRRASQYAIATNTVPTCNVSTIPTSTTACDVPGPPMMLQYDPAIPLYNFATNVDSFSFLPPSPIFSFEFFTKNELLFITNAQTIIMLDASMNVLLDIYQTIMNDIGVIVMGTGLQVNSESFHFSVPVGIWITGFITDNAKQYITNHPDDNNNPNVTIHIDTYSINVIYSGTTIYSQTGISNSGQLQDVSFNILNLNLDPATNFYAIQYVGNVEFDLISLPVQPTFIYDIQIEYTYYYPQIRAVYEEGDFQSGVFTNLSETNQNLLYNCALSTTPAIGYAPSSFTQFSVPSAFGLTNG